MMSKMTVGDFKTQTANYGKLVFVEFLEVLCRAARQWQPPEDLIDK